MPQIGAVEEALTITPNETCTGTMTELDATTDAQGTE